MVQRLYWFPRGIWSHGKWIGAGHVVLGQSEVEAREAHWRLGHGNW